MSKLNDDRVEKPKSEFELNQDAIMKALTDIASALKGINEKMDKQYADFVKYARAGKF